MAMCHLNICCPSILKKCNLIPSIKSLHLEKSIITVPTNFRKNEIGNIQIIILGIWNNCTTDSVTAAYLAISHSMYVFHEHTGKLANSTTGNYPAEWRRRPNPILRLVVPIKLMWRANQSDVWSDFPKLHLMKIGSHTLFFMHLRKLPKAIWNATFFYTKLK